MTPFLLSLVLAGTVAVQDAPSREAQQIGRPVVAGDHAPQADDTVTIVRALDKVTARITELELPAGKEVPFGSLLIRARTCYARPPEETPETFAYLEIDEVHDGARKRVFSGWMVASSPALHGLEHPIYDVWVIACRTAAPEADSGKE
ncbi:MAG: DUF2155 domain-containing protein [Rhodothalassiaceae bacterium]